MATRHPAVVKALNLALTETGCTRDQAASIVISGLVEAGLPIEQAFDAVFGPCAYQSVADSVWQQLSA